VLVRIRLLTRFAAQGLAEIPEMLQTQAVMRPHLKETFMPRIRRVSVASLAMLLLLLAPIQTVAAGSSQRCAAPPGPGVDLHGCDLSGATLRIDLQGINLARADLRGVIAGCDPDLRSANLSGMGCGATSHSPRPISTTRTCATPASRTRRSPAPTWHRPGLISRGRPS
jgi:hypothetical protein